MSATMITQTSEGEGFKIKGAAVRGETVGAPKLDTKLPVRLIFSVTEDSS